MTTIHSSEGTIQAKDGTKIFFSRNSPPQPKAIVIIIHGVSEHSGRYAYIAKCLNKFGYGVYRFDNRGHGRSGGERGYVRNFMDFVEDVDLIVSLAHDENILLPLFMLGHSMGGFIATAYGITHPDQLNGQILTGPAVIELPIYSLKLLKLLPYNLLPKLRVKNKLSKIACRDLTVVENYQTDHLNLRTTTLKMSGEMFIKGPVWLQSNIKKYTLPCFILHGGEDLIVTPKSSKWLYDNISSKDKVRKVYSGLYHEILNEQEKDIVLTDIDAWIEKRIKA